MVHRCRFFKRYNNVVLDVAAVNKERGRLEQENADLRQLLKTFLDCIRWAPHPLEAWGCWEQCKRVL